MSIKPGTLAYEAKVMADNLRERLLACDLSLERAAESCESAADLLERCAIALAGQEVSS